MSDDVVDFRKPARVSEDIGQMLTQWQDSAQETAELRWAKCALGNVKIQGVPPTPLSGSELRGLDEACIVYRIDIGDATPTLMAVPQTLALGLVNELLGATTDEPPEIRELTEIETTCLEFLLEEFRQALESSQLLRPTKRLRLVGRVKLKELHSEFPENATNTEVGFTIGLTAGQHKLRWILDQDTTLDMVTCFSSGKSQDGHDQQKLQKLICSAEAPLCIRLGRAQLEISALSKLKPGDVLVLDQKIDEPFAAVLGGTPVFRGWGARVGVQQAFQIDDVLDS